MIGYFKSDIVDNQLFDITNISAHDILSELKKYNKFTDEDIDNIHFSKFYIDNDEFYIIDNDYKDLLKNTPLNNHTISQFDNKFKDYLVKSLKFIKNNFNKEYEIIRSNIKVFVNVEIKHNHAQNESTLTSCTLPSLPYFIFISQKALFHIPPNSISSFENHMILSENIFHEALHQIVNLSILFDTVLPENYDSKYSKKITIPWRQQQKENRNKDWEIDRVFHATVVYANLISFRKSLLNALDDTEKDIYFFFNESMCEAEKSFEYLLSALKSNINLFGLKGKLVINAMDQYYEEKKSI